MEREKYAGQPFKEAGKVLVSVTCFSLFNEQPGWSRHRFFSIPHKYFLITLYERYSFYKCYSSARTMASNLKGVLVKLWWHLLTRKHWKEQRLETWQSSGLAFYLKTGMQFGRDVPLHLTALCFAFKNDLRAFELVSFRVGVNSELCSQHPGVCPNT